MIKFYIEPGYDVKHPEREYGNAGIDFYIPNATDLFKSDFELKNMQENAMLIVDPIEEKTFIRIAPHGRANIPSGVRSRISPNIALEAQNKSGIATKHGLVYGAATIDASYKGIIHISVINTTSNYVMLPVGMKIMQFLPRLISVEEVDVCTTGTVEEFYKDFEFTNRGEGAFGSTGV